MHGGVAGTGQPCAVATLAACRWITVTLWRGGRSARPSISSRNGSDIFARPRSERGRRTSAARPPAW
ncbi:hypothetical protein [Nonomuraea sp. KM90]|uniref:hypothetical protein n=1 Tax=Nonomuraea sp. KM90 TaxID=3457428 RepID=UPI003FCCAF60